MYMVDAFVGERIAPRIRVRVRLFSIACDIR